MEPTVLPESVSPAKRREDRTLRIAVIAFAIIEAIAMVPLVFYLAGK